MANWQLCLLPGLELGACAMQRENISGGQEVDQLQTADEVTVPECPPHPPGTDIWAVCKPAAEPLELFSTSRVG